VAWRTKIPKIDQLDTPVRLALLEQQVETIIARLNHWGTVFLMLTVAFIGASVTVLVKLL